MADYEIRGTVVERGTRRGVQGLYVEAWDRDTRYHDMLGRESTDGAGRFRMRFTDEYFGDFAPDRLPDVFYRVFRDDALILSTQEKPSENQRGPRIDITLEIEPLVEPAAPPDRVDAATATKALTFLLESDFRGLRREAGEHVRLSGGLVREMFAGGFRRWDWKPIRPSELRRSDVVGQDTQAARATLAARNVAVERVEEYHPGLDRASARLLTAPPVRLAEGERVVLYQESGRVKYYARVREPAAATLDQAEVRRLGGELAAVQRDLGDVHEMRREVETLRASTDQGRDETAAEVSALRLQLAEMAELRVSVTEMRTELTQRNQTIAGLQAELSSVRASQERIERTDLVQRIDRLEGSVRVAPRGRPRPS